MARLTKIGRSNFLCIFMLVGVFVLITLWSTLVFFESSVVYAYREENEDIEEDTNGEFDFLSDDVSSCINISLSYLYLTCIIIYCS
jgi:hypothetical protein